MIGAFLASGLAGTCKPLEGEGMSKWSHKVSGVLNEAPLLHMLPGLYADCQDCLINAQQHERYEVKI